MNDLEYDIDGLAQRIDQAHALALVMDTEDFESFSDEIRAHYKWALWTLLGEAKELLHQPLPTTPGHKKKEGGSNG
jgi:hypothetical protein